MLLSGSEPCFVIEYGCTGWVCPFWVFTVVTGVECPKQLWTVLTSMPALMRRLAFKCPNTPKTHRSYLSFAIVDNNGESLCFGYYFHVIVNVKSERYAGKVEVR